MIPQPARTRVLIADDHAVVREGIKSIVAEAPDMVVVGEAFDGAEVLAKTEAKQPDIVVLDVQMPRGGGLEALRALRRLHPGVAVLILSFHSELIFAVPFLREGASGYVAKENTGATLLDALRKVRDGRRYVSAAVAESIARRLTSRALPHELLSAQELVVLSLLTSGRTADEIASELRLSKRVVSRCCGRILHKTGLHNLAAVIQYGLTQDRRGLTGSQLHCHGV